MSNDVKFWPIRPTAVRSLRRGDMIHAPLGPNTLVLAKVTDFEDHEKSRIIDRYLAGINTDPMVKELLMKRYEPLGGRGQLLAKLNAGTVPQRLQQELGEPRNNAAHAGASPNEVEANTAIDKAVELVEQAYPLTSLLPAV